MKDRTNVDRASTCLHNTHNFFLTMTHILFVCLGNICRSSAAEEVFRTLVARRGLSAQFAVDSAGLIDYHEGELSDPRMIRHAARRGYRLTHRSRPVTVADFARFHYIVGMDERNMQGLTRLAARAPHVEAQMLRMADFLTAHTADLIPDPYYGDDADFEHVLDLLEDAAQGLLDNLMGEEDKR